MSANQEAGESARSNETGDRFVGDQYQARPVQAGRLRVLGTGGEGGRLSHITNVVFFIFLLSSNFNKKHYRSRSQTLRLLQYYISAVKINVLSTQLPTTYHNYIKVESIIHLKLYRIFLNEY